MIQLMGGWFQDPLEAVSIAESLDIDIESKSSQVVVFDIDWAATGDAPESDRVVEGSLLLEGFLDQLTEGQFMSHAVMIDGSLACLILALGEDSLDDPGMSTELFRTVSLVRQLVSDKMQLRIRAALGKVGAGIDDIAESYTQAMGLIDYAVMVGEKGGVSRFSYDEGEASESLEGISWTKKEVYFLNCVRAEDYEEANAMYNELILSDYARNAPSLELAKHRKLALVNILINAREEILRTFGENYSGQLCSEGEIVSCVSLQELGQCATRMFTRVSYISVARKSGSSYERMANVTEYILSCFRDPDLNVNSIALHFSLNPSYLSRTFKSMMGIGLFQFIQHLRIKEAKHLMRDTDDSIKTIAERAGFSNALAMNRAFKKQEGITPSSLRVSFEDAEGIGHRHRHRT